MPQDEEDDEDDLLGEPNALNENQILRKQINELKKQNSELRELVRESVVQTSLDLAQDVGEAAAPGQI